jgi:hypothetical protein
MEVAEQARAIADRSPAHSASARRIEALAWEFDERRILALLTEPSRGRPARRRLTAVVEGRERVSGGKHTSRLP